MAVCKSCNSENIPGIRWCTICRTNLINPRIGRLSSPGKRFAAYFIDSMIPVVAVFMALIFAGAGGAADGEVDAKRVLILVMGVLLAYTIWAFILFARGTTPGKLMLGMHVVGEDGLHAGFFRMLFREWIGKWISGLILSLGFLWILFDRDRQGWHDKFASTYVIEPSTAGLRSVVRV